MSDTKKNRTATRLGDDGREPVTRDEVEDLKRRIAALEAPVKISFYPLTFTAADRGKLLARALAGR